MFNWHKKSKLSEQLKFFGAKKQGFISVYASKPRIRVKVKSDKISINVNKWRFESAAYQAHRAGMAAQANMQANNGANLASLQALGMQGIQCARAQQGFVNGYGLGMYGGQAGGLGGAHSGFAMGGGQSPLTQYHGQFPIF